MRIAAIVLAAGEGRRMGGPKALLRHEQQTFLGHLCGVLRDAGADTVVAVTGAEAERVREQAHLPAEVRVVVNASWKSGMLSSLLCGLDEAQRLGADAVLVQPVDSPFVAPATVAAVAAALRQGATIAVPSHAGRRGHPAGFSRLAFPALRAADPARGARSVLSANPAWIVYVPAAADCLIDVDKAEDLERSQ